MRRTAWTLFAVATIVLAACGQARPVGPAAQAAPRQAVTSFDGHAIWFSGGRQYPEGLRRVRQVRAPWSYEAVQLNQFGPASLIYAATSGKLPQDGSWGAGIRLGKLRAFSVNGRSYVVPKALTGMDIAVLPLARGMVWLATPAHGPENMVGPALGTKTLNPQALQGFTAIYYTPYLSKGGSLLDGRETIAVLPHRWTGLDGPVAASAWAGWLPQDRVRPPGTASAAAHRLSFDPSQRVSADRVATKSLPGYPTIFLHDVPELQAGQHALVAWIGQMTRTAGGFELDVRFFDTNYGLDASQLASAEYYWSETKGVWTPLTQIFADQDIESFVDVGSQAVYWQQALAVPPGDGSRLDLVQMAFYPGTDTIAPVWAGNYIYGRTFVDGRSWVHDMLRLNPRDPTGPALSVWTANTP